MLGDFYLHVVETARGLVVRVFKPDLKLRVVLVFVKYVTTIPWGKRLYVTAAHKWSKMSCSKIFVVHNNTVERDVLAGFTYKLSSCSIKFVVDLLRVKMYGVSLVISQVHGM